MERAMLFLSITIYLNVAYVVAVPHLHSKKLSKEVEAHGAYSPHDQNHYQEGEHNSEFDHEAILGSKDAAEEFDQLPPDEAKKRLKALAIKMDSNNDGFVDKRELMNWVLRSFSLLTEEEALERLEDDDADENGLVTWEEHLQETFGNYGDEDSSRSDNNNDLMEEKRMMIEDQVLFKAADINDDGFLDKKEYAGFSHPEEFEYMHKTLYEQTMKKKDQNKDDFLTIEEFLVDGTGRFPDTKSEYYIIEKDRFENEFDLDKDGKLNKAEVLNWLIPNNRDMAETEADHLIDSSDSNDDGKLSIQEIVDNHDIFVGSEATDFGEHLHNTHKFTDEL